MSSQDETSPKAKTKKDGERIVMNMSKKPEKVAARGCCLGLSLVIALGLGVLPVCPKANAQRDVGTSQADLPTVYARFWIDNPSGKPIKYSVKWGKDGGYTEYTRSGIGPWYHQHPLTGPHKAPQPYVHFGAKTIPVHFGEFGGGGAFGGEHIDSTVRYKFFQRKDGMWDFVRADNEAKG